MLVNQNWEVKVRNALNELMIKNKDQNRYVVFDFDNTCSIFDSAEMVMNYQMMAMDFKMDTEDLKKMISSGLGDYPIYTSYIEDIIQAYDLYLKTNELQWKNEFTIKLRAFYPIIDQLEGAEVAYPWACYFFTNMNEKEAYGLSYKGLDYYAALPTTKVHHETTLSSKTGNIAYDTLEGISVTSNIQELFHELKKANIDIWIVSASQIDVVRAALDVFHLSTFITGLIGMTCKQKDGIYLPQLEDSGYYYTYENQWIRHNTKVYAKTQGIGKVKAIDDLLVPRYNSGPIAGFMDSTGDFEFCTLYQSLQLVVCFNRASRSIQDGGGLISELAIYQNDILGYTLEKANQLHDTYYVLQGRDENSRTLRNARESILYGEVNSRLFKNEENQKMLELFIKEQFDTTTILNTYSLIGNVENLNYGFLLDYQGYHTK